MFDPKGRTKTFTPKIIHEIRSKEKSNQPLFKTKKKKKTIKN
jgi:hypothetical protein